MKKWLLSSIFLVFIFTSVAYGLDYFIYDAEQKQILEMKSEADSFTAKLTLDKDPAFLMPTSDPDRYLAVLSEEKDVDDPKQSKKKPKNLQPGRLILYNSATGRTEDLVQVGYYPFKFAASPDRKHFFITYKPTLKSKTVELLHYNVSEMKTEKISDFGAIIRELAVSLDGSQLYSIIEDKAEKVSFVVISFMPLKVESRTDLKDKYRQMYLLGPHQVALTAGWTVKLIDTLENRVLKEVQFQKGYRSYFEYHRKERVLIGVITVSAFGGDRENYLKVTADDILTIEAKSFMQNATYAEYIHDRNQLYVLSMYGLRMVDFNSLQVEKLDSGGMNWTVSSKGQVYHRFERIPESNMAVIYCPQSGKVRFFDLDRNQVVKAVSSGRYSRKLLNSFTLNLFGAPNYTVVATDADQARFYILNRSSGDITVFDRDYQVVNYLIPEEFPYTMYQVKKPVLQTLVICDRRIYKIDAEALIPLADFETEIKEFLLIEDNNRIIFVTDRELLVLNSATFEVQNRLNLYGDPEAKYLKLKKGEQRYYYIKTPFMDY